MIKRLVIAISILLVLSTVVFAQSFFSSITNIFESVLPNVVYDPTVASAVTAATSVLNSIDGHTNDIAGIAKTAATAIPAVSRLGWNFPVPGLNFPASTNTFGSSAGWLQAINTGVGVWNAYKMASISPRNPQLIYNALSLAGQLNMAGHYATMEIGEGLAQHTMSITGAARSNWVEQSRTLGQLQNDSLSTDPTQNTEVGVLNKINAATMIHAQSVQNTNQLLSAIADNQAVDLKLRHDVMVDELNSAGAALAAVPQTINTLFGGDAAAHNARIP